LPALATRLSASASPAKPARTEEEALRWRAYLTVVEEDEREEVVVYCPDCAKREFGLDDG
jgi:hypothetical protein